MACARSSYQLWGRSHLSSLAASGPNVVDQQHEALKAQHYHPDTNSNNKSVAGKQTSAMTTS
jgi:hypothetical protein